MEEAYVRVETHKGITSIEFYHPQSNSLPAKILPVITFSWADKFAQAFRRNSVSNRIRIAV